MVCIQPHVKRRSVITWFRVVCRVMSAHNLSENVNSHRHVNTHSDTIFEDLCYYRTYGVCFSNNPQGKTFPAPSWIKPSITSNAMNPTHGKMEERQPLGCLPSHEKITAQWFLRPRSGIIWSSGVQYKVIQQDNYGIKHKLTVYPLITLCKQLVTLKCRPLRYDTV